MATRSLTVRTLGSEDTAFAVETVRAVQPEHPWHEEELLTWWRMCERMGELRRIVLEVDGRPAGWAMATKWRDAPDDEGRMMVFLAGVAPDELDRAWAHAEDVALGLDVGLGRTLVWETQTDELEVLERRGWERKRIERFWRLELAGQRDRLAALREPARRRVEAAGIVLTTAAELGGVAVYPKLHSLDERAGKDIPRSTPYVPVPYDAWKEWMRPPAVVPERLWVATREGEPIGLSYLDYGSTPVTTAFTGVLREHRGHGVARALKLETMVQAIDLGVDAVETENDAENAPILHLNEELGYHQIPGRVQLHKRLR